MIFSYYDGPITNPNPFKDMNVKELYEIIKEGSFSNLKEKIKLIRETEDKEKRNILKMSLPYVTIGGKFNIRNKNGLKEPSGLICADVDGLDDLSIIDKWKKDKYTHCIFKSPSGNGFKIIIKINKPEDKNEYEEYFNAYSKYQENEGIDITNIDSQTKDISRACFLSYDPNIYYNENSEIFKHKIKKEYEKNNYSGVMNGKVEKGNRNNSLFKLACSYNTQGIDKETALLNIKLTNNKFDNPLDNYEITKIVESAYSYEKEKKDISKVREEVYEALNDNKRNKATEIICDYLKNNFEIRSIENDKDQEIYYYEDGIYKINGISFLKKKIRELIGYKFSIHLINSIISKIEVDMSINEKIFRENNLEYKYLIPLKNGLFDLKQNKIIPFTSKIYFLNKLPITYDKNKKCDKIISFFKSIFEKEDDIKIIQELFGYLLVRRYKYHKIFMFLGKGRNGKGVTLELIKRFLGVENTSGVPLHELLSDEFSKSLLLNKLANLAGDIENHELKKVGQLKSLSGEDLISANRKFQNRITFQNYAKLIFACNQLPKTSDLSDGFFSRWILINFPYKFVDKYELNDNINNKLMDNNLINKITNEDELSGLFNWALEGLLRLEKNQGFTNSLKTEEVKIEWLRKSSSFRAFCMDYLVEDYEKSITKSFLSKIYNEYCKKNKINVESSKVIKNTLEDDFGVIEKRIRDNDDDFDERCWYGISFKEKTGRKLIKGNKNIVTLYEFN